MTTNAQFLFFYVDELIKHHWVDWVEGPLGGVPLGSFDHPRGFQDALGDRGAGPRTRAGEAYNLGILSDRIVKSQTGGADFPSGWRMVIEGKLPATMLGHYSFVIGKALRQTPEDHSLNTALDCLASIFLLHIGYKSDGRWFNTSLLYKFSEEQLEQNLGRKLMAREARYLAAAVINTAESDNSDLLLEPYQSLEPLKELLFDLNDETEKRFQIERLPQIVDDNEIGINDFKKTKAALFWSNSERGIYSRSSRSVGVNLISELMKTDRLLSNRGKPNLLSSMLEGISKNQHNPGIFEMAPEIFADNATLIELWTELETQLFVATNRSVETLETTSRSDAFLTSQRTIRQNKQQLQENKSSKGVFDGREVSENQIVPSSDGNKNPSNLESAGRKSSPAPSEITFPSAEKMSELISSQLDTLKEDPPKSKKSPKEDNSGPKVARVSKIDFAEKESRNRQIGDAGEQFIFLYEKEKLLAAGLRDLSERVIWASKEIGDGLGYDISSFDETGNQIYIEVKTTSGGRGTPFYVTNNEVAVSKDKGDTYCLVRLFNFPNDPKFFVLTGDLTTTLTLEATSYRASIS